MTSVAGAMSCGTGLIAAMLAASCASTPPNDVQTRRAELSRVAASTIAPPPLAELRTFTELVSGVEVTDPYRWLEAHDDPAAARWNEAQRAYAAQVLSLPPGQAALAESIGATLDSAPTLDAVMFTPSGALVSRWLADGRYLFKVSPTDDEQQLVSTSALAESGRGVRLRRVTSSWDGSAAAIAATGGDDGALQISVIDTETGAFRTDRVGEMLTTTNGARFQVAWLPDDSGFIYPRLAAGALDGPASARFARGAQFLHRLGTPQASDVPVFGFGVAPEIEFAPDDLASRVVMAPGSAWAVATLSRVAEARVEFWAAPVSSLGETNLSWRRFDDGTGELQSVALDGARIYGISTRGADRGEIVYLDLNTQDGAATTLLAERAGVLASLVVAQDAIYVSERVNGTMTLLRVNKASGAATPIELPVTGTLTLYARPDTDGMYAEVTNFDLPPDFYEVNADGSVKEASFLADGADGTSQSEFQTEVVTVPARDGTLVPVSLLYRRDGELNGRTPLLIEVYGSHGVSNDPSFNPPAMIWAQRGGVYAFAHVRGGGEGGRAWHMAARRNTKHLSATDAIDVARGLAAKGYGTEGRIALMGTSSGATIPGLAAAMDPALFAALVFDIGQPDEVRGAQIDPTAARNLAESGDMTSQDGVRALIANSPYFNLPDRITLPAMMVLSARGDYNFGGEATAAKYVARLQAANAGDAPVIWISSDRGHTHVFGAPPEELASTLTFLFWRTGHPAFQPGQSHDASSN